LAENDLQKIIQKVLTYYSKQKDSKKVYLTQDAIDHLVKFSSGDARTLINALEMAIETTTENDAKEIYINLSIAEDAIQKKNIVYDKNGQNHYDVISAFIKSIRGSNPDATLFWLANMLEAGEDPNFIFRRLLISASEDIGMADPNAIVVVKSCCDAFDRVGFPEGLYFLTQASLYLAISPKSNSTKSIFKAIETIKFTNAFDVPGHLKNNSNSYVNPHNFPGNWVEQEYLPKFLRDLKMWEPNNNGWEKTKYEELLRRKEN
jgi:putative ATPase